MSRLWRDGDAVESHLPMTLRSEPLHGHPNVVAILNGLIVLAGVAMFDFDGDRADGFVLHERRAGARADALVLNF